MYYQVITEPIDLSIIEQKIQRREYQKFEEIENDFKLMVNNCETFNGPKNGYSLMAYGVWRAFKRASLKHLERELTHNESTAFIYPPKVTNTNIKPAIEAKKKKMRSKRKSTFKALDVLAEAAEKAVEANESRATRIPASLSSSFGESSPGSTQSYDSNICVSVKESSNQMENSLQIHGDMWANFLCNANSNPNKGVITCTAPQTPVNPSLNENLTFKSLEEWSKSIKQSGNGVVLPQHAVIISSPQFTQCTNGPAVSPQFSLKVVSTGNPIVSTSIVNTMNGSPVFTSSVISNNENASKELVNTDPKRLVIKLSRCESQQVWRPVTLITSTAQNNFIPTSVQTNGHSISSSTQQFQGLRSIPTNCVPVKKRIVIQDFNNQSIVEEKPSVALNMNPITQNLNPNSQSFEITGKSIVTLIKKMFLSFDLSFAGIQQNQNSKLKVFHLKKLDQTSNVYNSPSDQTPKIPKFVFMPLNKVSYFVLSFNY